MKISLNNGGGQVSIIKFTADFLGKNWSNFHHQVDKRPSLSGQVSIITEKVDKRPSLNKKWTSVHH